VIWNTKLHLIDASHRTKTIILKFTAKFRYQLLTVILLATMSFNWDSNHSLKGGGFWKKNYAYFCFHICKHESFQSTNTCVCCKNTFLFVSIFNVFILCTLSKKEPSIFGSSRICHNYKEEKNSLVLYLVR
jgi:hypothetical protein